MKLIGTDKYNNDVICICGSVYSKGGNFSPIYESNYGGIRKCTFVVTASAKKTYLETEYAKRPLPEGTRKTVYDFDQYLCAFYYNIYCKAEYELVKTLRKDERVVVFGRIYKTTEVDKVTGEEKMKTELRVEDIILPQRLALLCLGHYETRGASLTQRPKNPEQVASADDYGF